MADNARDQLGVDLPEPPEPQIQEIPPEEQGDQRPEWLPEKFQTVEDYNASYKSLEDELRRRGENERQMQAQMSQLTEMVEQLQEPQQQSFQQQGWDPNVRQQLQESFDNDPIGTMAYLAQQYSQMEINQRFQQMQEEASPLQQQQQETQNQMLAMTVDRGLSERYADWGEYKDRVAEEIMQDNSLLTPDALRNPETTMRALSRVYENVKARDILQNQQNGGGFVNDQMKRQAQTLSGTTGRPGEPSAEDEKMAALIAATKGLSYSAFRGGA